ncbi:upstream-binding factor 1-like protein 1 [Herpailurus yagouaroundi]|uniref:upstream-binding factor 1-like protein 1 n=1 Tax=Herpailurus yagouaroundi TaxID=1608482 RepID=UPI001AD6D0C5|nr:upstream-binding factor 1-like protein 1 [Puma yagouaroundi]
MALSRGQSHWSKEDIVKLLDRMETNLPSNDSHTFKTTQSQMDWEKLAFKDYSGEMCKLKWLEVSYHLRKFRTLTELVLEAKEHVEKPDRSKKRKKHPDLPKKPLTAYLRFFMEKRPQCSQKYPNLSNQELTKVLSKKYKELPEKIKLKYIQDFQKEKQEFEEKLAQFKDDHPDLFQNPNNSDVTKRSPNRAQKKFPSHVPEVKSPLGSCFSKRMIFRGEPRKPPMNGYEKFHRDLWSSRELRDVPPRERRVEIGRRWQRVPQSQKDHYKQQAEELQKQYKVDLDDWLKTLSPEQYAAYREATYSKRKNMSMRGRPDPKVRRTDLQLPSGRSLQEGLGQESGLQAPETESPETTGGNAHASWGSGEDEEGEEGEEGRSSSDSSSGSECEDCEFEDSGSNTSSLGDSSDADPN